MVQIVRIPPPDVDDGEDSHGPNDSDDRNGPDGDGVAFHGVSEVRHHAGADEPVERLDDVEQHVDGDQEEQRHPVPRVRPRHPGHRRQRQRARRGGGLRHLQRNDSN